MLRSGLEAVSSSSLIWERPQITFKILQALVDIFDFRQADITNVRHEVCDLSHCQSALILSKELLTYITAAISRLLINIVIT